jgi:O-acetyl-ADP-ribose deacetylase (regulator of RNase III)
MKKPMKIVFLNYHRQFIDEVKKIMPKDEVISGHSELSIEYHVGDVREYPIENTAFVSPANSLGFMDGGIDAAYMLMFDCVQANVRYKIRLLDMQTNLGRPYLPIGSALYVNVGETTILISAPTMFLPHNVADTNNAYHAFMAALCMYEKALEKCPYLTTMVCPAMCTGYGEMDPTKAVEQMRKALVDFLEGRRPEQVRFQDTEWCYITPLHDNEQPRIFDNREIQE